MRSHIIGQIRNILEAALKDGFERLQIFHIVASELQIIVPPDTDNRHNQHRHQIENIITGISNDDGIQRSLFTLILDQSLNKGDDLLHVDGHFAQVADCQLLEIADVLEVEVAGEAFLNFLHELLFLGEELAEEGDLWVLFEVAVDYL